jgi:uncharacterized protein (TIGR00251 family)
LYEQHTVSEYDALLITEHGGAERSVRFAVRVQPRSSRTGVDGMHAAALRVRVNAPPVENAANEAVVTVLAKTLGVAKRAVVIFAGARSRSKVVAISGLRAADVRRRLG